MSSDQPLGSKKDLIRFIRRTLDKEKVFKNNLEYLKLKRIIKNGKIIFQYSEYILEVNEQKMLFKCFSSCKLSSSVTHSLCAIVRSHILYFRNTFTFMSKDKTSTYIVFLFAQKKI